GRACAHNLAIRHDDGRPDAGDDGGHRRDQVPPGDGDRNGTIMVVMTASAPFIAATSESTSSTSPRAISTPRLSSLLASLVGRTRARTPLPRLSRSSTTLPPREPVAPTTRTGRVVVMVV